MESAAFVPESEKGDSMSHGFDADHMAELMRDTRERTRELFDLVIKESDLRRSPGQGFRPILWHLGHIGAFEGYWILQRVKGDATISPRYDAIFDPIKTPREDSTNLPPMAEIESYLDRVREESLRFLSSFQPRASDPLVRDGYVFRMVLEHEYQHQETVTYLLQMLDPQLKKKDEGESMKDEEAARVNDEENDSSVHPRRAQAHHAPNSFFRLHPLSLVIPGGPFEMGARGYPFAYDNEQPPHTVELADYRIDARPVTNAEFAQFIEAGGYRTRSLWSEEGWAWKEEEKIDRPLYWTLRQGDRWHAQEMFEERAIEPDRPVVGVSWHEAESYAKFVGKRLPTEAEWEKAASWDTRARAKRRFSWGDEPPTAELTNFDGLRWATTPVTAFPEGRSAYGCFDMTGNVWEWTSTTFGPYAGFEAFPYPEYSEAWFDGDHKVLKGGSWATRADLLRCSFRDFFRPRFRIAFAGFRCAANE
jgi:ergothioneine biosynthesis protein EgtB